MRTASPDSAPPVRPIEEGGTMLVTIAGRPVHVDAEGFLTHAEEWDEEVAAELAADLGIELDDERLAVLRFAHDDYLAQGASPTMRRIAVTGGFGTRRLFALFPKKPAKVIAYLAGVPKPVGCV